MTARSTATAMTDPRGHRHDRSPLQTCSGWSLDFRRARRSTSPPRSGSPTSCATVPGEPAEVACASGADPSRHSSADAGARGHRRDAQASDDRFTLTAMGEFLRRTSRGRVRRWRNSMGRPNCWQAWGEPAPRGADRRNRVRSHARLNVWDYRSRCPEETRIFDRRWRRAPSGSRARCSTCATSGASPRGRCRRRRRHVPRRRYWRATARVRHAVRPAAGGGTRRGIAGRRGVRRALPARWAATSSPACRAAAMRICLKWILHDWERCRVGRHPGVVPARHAAGGPAARGRVRIGPESRTPDGGSWT